MKPISLEIENFRSFRARRTIAFGEPRLFAVLGDTGAGKSTLLEAITYALFNRSTWSGRNVKELVARGARTMSVAFTFAVGGDEFTVQRVTPRGAGQPVQRLLCAARGIDVSAQRDVDAAVREALRLDAETFLHTVLLRQGMHAELLTKDPGQRDAILAELFGLDDLARVDARAKSFEERAGAFLEMLENDRAGVGGDPAVQLAAGSAALASAEARLAVAEQAVHDARVLDERIAALEVVVVRAGDRAKPFAGAEMLLDEVAALDAVAGAIGAALADAERRVAATVREREQAHAALAALRAAGEDTAALLARQRALEAAQAALGELDRQRDQLAEAEAALGAARAAEATVDDEVGARQAAAAAARDALAVEAARLERARTSQQRLAAALVARDAAERALAEARAQQRAREAELAALQGAVADAGVTVTQADAATALAQEGLEAARRTDLVAAVAADVHGGDPCPVCERPLPAGFAPRASGSLAAVQRVAKDAAARADTARAALGRLEREFARLQGASDEGRRGAELAERELREAQARLDGEVPTGADARTFATAAASEVAALEAEAAARRDGAERADAALADAAAYRATIQERCAGQLALRDRAADEVGRWQQALGERVAALPSAERASAAAGDFAGSRAGLARALERAAGAERALEAASAVASVALEERNARAAERAERVGAPHARIVGRASGLAELLARAAAPQEEAAVRAWVQEVVAAAVAERARCEAEAAHAARERETAAAEHSALVQRLGGEPEAVRSAAHVERQSAAERVRAAHERIEKAAALDAKIARLTPVRNGLGQLREALGAQQFRAYASAQRRRRLLDVASAIFREMRDGRYEFTPDFAIRDHLDNEVRPAQTLSGGEKFLASLALALGAVEIAASAGARIEALFLDEGFDALDAATLPEAMMELHKRACGGRMICVITHLSEAAQFVKDAMLVRTTADGSEVVPLDGPMDEDQAAAEGLVSRMAG